MLTGILLLFLYKKFAFRIFLLILGKITCCEKKTTFNIHIAFDFGYGI